MSGKAPPTPPWCHADAATAPGSWSGNLPLLQALPLLRPSRNQGVAGTQGETPRPRVPIFRDSVLSHRAPRGLRTHPPSQAPPRPHPPQPAPGGPEGSKPASSLPGLSCSRPSHWWLPGPPAESFMLLAQPWLQIAGCSPDSGPGIQPPSLTRRAPACPYLCPLQSGPPASICSRRHTACSLHHSEMSVEHLYMLSTVPKASPAARSLQVG